jgi:hypothetical protein
MKVCFALLCFSLLNGSILMAQTENGPTSKHPFGKPNPNAPKEISDYQPLIGLCDCSSYRKGKDNNWLPPIAMTWEFKYIMNGMAVQDETLKADSIHTGSIRQYNADSSTWYVHYYTTAVASPSLKTWKGGTVNNDIVLYSDQPSPNGLEGFYKITFSDISNDGFNWLGAWVNKDESIVFPTWKIECKKRK